MDEHARLAELADRTAIRELTARYNRAWDDGRADDWAGTFTDDGVFDAAGGLHAEGRDALRAAADAAEWGIVHITTDALVTVDGDSAIQECTVVTAVRSVEPKRVAFTSTGRYRDELVRTPEGWRFSRRSVAMDAPARP